MTRDDRFSGKRAAAFALGWGTVYEAERADAKAIALDATTSLKPHLISERLDVTPEHLAGAADFFRELADALQAMADAADIQS